MQIVKEKSRAERLAEILEQNILSGKLKTGCKLKSVRMTADEFKVDPQVARDAYNILAGKRLVVKKPRQGIYASGKAFHPEKLEIFSLSVGQTAPLDENYIDKVFRIDTPSALQLFNYTSRIIFKSDMDFDTLVFELDKIARLHPDCVIVAAAYFTEREIEQCLKLPVPVIFAGGFHQGIYPELQFNLFQDSPLPIGKFCVETMLNQNIREITIFTSQKNYWFPQEMKKGALQAAEKNGCKLNFIHAPDSRDQDDYRKNWSKVAKSFIANGNSAQGIVAYGISIDPFINEFYQAGLQPGRDFTLLCSRHVPGAIYIKEDYSGFRKAAIKHIKEIIKNPKEYRKIDLSDKIKRTAVFY